MYQVAVDIGGTLTDCVVVGADDGRSVAKWLTIHESLPDGVLAALQMNANQLCAPIEALLGQTSLFVHGTKVGTIAVPTRTGAKSGLITTKGHENALIFGKVFAKRAGLGERDVVHTSRLYKPLPPLRRQSVSRASPKGTDVNELGLDELAVIRDFCCPGYGTAVTLDAQRRDELIFPGCRFGDSTNNIQIPLRENTNRKDSHEPRDRCFTCSSSRV